MNKKNINEYLDLTEKFKEEDNIIALNLLEDIKDIRKKNEIEVSKFGANIYNRIKELEQEDIKKILMNVFFNELNNLSWYGIFAIQVRISENQNDIKILNFIELHDKKNDWSTDLINELLDMARTCSGQNIYVKIERKIKGLQRKISRNISDNFGVILSELRKEMGLSLSELSSLCNVSGSYISRLEKNDRKAPSVPIANNIAKVFGEKGQKLLDCINIANTETKSFADLIYKNNFSLANFKANADNKKFIIELVNKIFSDNKNLTKEQMDNILNNINL